MLNTMFPCDIEIDTWDLGQDIHRNRLSAHSKERTRLSEIGRAKAFKRSPELR